MWELNFSSTCCGDQKLAMSAAGRRIRAFKRWMASNGIEYSNALDLCFQEEDGCSVSGIGVRALCSLKEGDLIAIIPKRACLTTRTCGVIDAIQEAGLGGSLGLAVAIMYERTLGPHSPFYGYLQLLPHQECVPLVWSSEEVHTLLQGTELHKVVMEDRLLLYEDWEESIVPLTEADPMRFPAKSFSLEHYFAAKTLIGSRAFQIDDYHEFGMVPLADLFNHKTAAEDVHFTSAGNEISSDDDTSDSCIDTEEISSHSCCGRPSGVCSHTENGNVITDAECASPSEEFDSDILEMILVKDVKEGNEVFNTYGTLSNAALLHRYGFTESENPYDIVNIDLDLAIECLSLSVSDRHVRACIALWRKLGFTGCSSENYEYFEISACGEPQLELLTFLYIACLPYEDYERLNTIDLQSIQSIEDAQELIYSVTHEKETTKLISKRKKALGIVQVKGGRNDIGILTGTEKMEIDNNGRLSYDWLLNASVAHCLLNIVDKRDRLYGTSSLEEDVEALNNCVCAEKPKLFHSLSLRRSERMILEKLRSYVQKTQGGIKKIKN